MKSELKDFVERHVEVLLGEIGMKPELEGYKEIVIAMKLYFINGFRFKWLYELYHEVGKYCSGDVEKNIRMAIASVFTYRKSERLYELYGDLVSEEKDRPMAQYFIPRTIEILCERMEQEEVKG